MLFVFIEAGTKVAPAGAFFTYGTPLTCRNKAEVAHPSLRAGHSFTLNGVWRIDRDVLLRFDKISGETPEAFRFLQWTILILYA